MVAISPVLKHYIQVILGVVVAVVPSLDTTFPAAAADLNMVATVAGVLLSALGGHAIATAQIAAATAAAKAPVKMASKEEPKDHF